MTAADIDWVQSLIHRGWAVQWPVGDQGPAAEAPTQSRFLTALADHPAFTRPFNARLVAVGMAATNGHRRLVG